MTVIHDLLNANLHRVFNNRDAADRRAAIDEIYADDVVFGDPDGTVTGRDALQQRAGDLLDSAPADFQFVDDGPYYIGADGGALAWTFGPAGSPVARGLDIITVRDGRISVLRTMLVETAPAE